MIWPKRLCIAPGRRRASPSMRNRPRTGPLSPPSEHYYPHYPGRPALSPNTCYPTACNGAVDRDCRAGGFLRVFGAVGRNVTVSLDCLSGRVFRHTRSEGAEGAEGGVCPSARPPRSLGRHPDIFRQILGKYFRKIFGRAFGGHQLDISWQG